MDEEGGSAWQRRHSLAVVGLLIAAAEALGRWGGRSPALVPVIHGGRAPPPAHATASTVVAVVSEGVSSPRVPESAGRASPPGGAAAAPGGAAPSLHAAREWEWVKLRRDRDVFCKMLACLAGFRVAHFGGMGDLARPPVSMRI
jgi:hypothetical protein